MNLHRTLSQAALIAGALLLSVGLQALAFTPPSTSPPSADAPTPLNTGTSPQTKSGNLVVGYGLIVQSGNVGIDTPNPTAPLEVNGTIKSGTTPNPTWGNLIVGMANTNTVYAYSALCAGNPYGDCSAPTGGTTILGSGVRFPDGTLQTTAAGGNSVINQSNGCTWYSGSCVVGRHNFTDPNSFASAGTSSVSCPNGSYVASIKSTVCQSGGNSNDNTEWVSIKVETYCCNFVHP